MKPFDIIHIGTIGPFHKEWYVRALIKDQIHLRELNNLHECLIIKLCNYESDKKYNSFNAENLSKLGYEFVSYISGNYV